VHSKREERDRKKKVYPISCGKVSRLYSIKSEKGGGAQFGLKWKGTSRGDRKPKSGVKVGAKPPPQIAHKVMQRRSEGKGWAWVEEVKHPRKGRSESRGEKISTSYSKCELGGGGLGGCTGN